MSNSLSTFVIQSMETTGSAVTTPPAGSQTLYFNSADHLLYRKNSAGASAAIGGGGGEGTVTSIATATGLLGGTITTSGTISIDTSVGYSLVQWARNNGVSLSASDVTTSMKFQLTNASTVTGVRFWWPGGVGAKTVKVSLWDYTNTRVANTTIAVNSANVYTATFGSPVSVAATETYKDYWATAWVNDGSNYVYTGNAVSHPGYGQASEATTSFLANQFLFVQRFMYASGDAQPGSENTALYFPVEPVFTVP